MANEKFGWDAGDFTITPPDQPEKDEAAKTAEQIRNETAAIEQKLAEAGEGEDDDE